MQINPSAKRIPSAKKSPVVPTIIQSGRHHCSICHKKRLDRKLSIVFAHGFIGIHPIRACTATCIAKCILKILEANNSGSILTIKPNERG